MKNPLDRALDHLAAWADRRRAERILTSIENDRRKRLAEMAVTNGDADA